MKFQNALFLGLSDISGNCWAFIKMFRRASTYERYHQVLRDYIRPVFGKKPLDEITRGDVRDFLIKKSEELQPFIFRDIMSGLFNYAIDDEVIKTNPVAGIIKNMGIKKDKSEDVDPLNETDLAPIPVNEFDSLLKNDFYIQLSFKKCRYSIKN